MKKEKDKLHELIHALSKPEKRFFKLWCNRNEPDQEKTYLYLFDVLSKMQQYRQEVVIQHLEAIGVKRKYLNYNKNFLYNKILSSLRAFYESDSVELQVKEILEYVDILYNKGLSSQAMTQIRKAKRLSNKHELISFLPEILRWERKINGPPLNEKTVEKFYKDYEEAIEKLTDFNELDFLFWRSNVLRHHSNRISSPEEQQALEHLLEHPLLRENKTKSFYSAVRYFQIKAAIFYSLDNQKEEYENNKALLEFMEEHPNFILEYPRDYSTVFSRVLILSKKQEPDLYPGLLQKFREFGENAPRDKARVQSFTTTLSLSTELVRLIDSGAYQEGIELFPVIHKAIKKHRSFLSDTYLVNMYYKISYVYFAAEDYSNSLKYINKVINEFDEYTRPDIFSYAKLLQMLIHVELGNTSILPYLSQAAFNHFKSRKKLFQSEKVILTYIKKIPAIVRQKKWKQTLESLREELLAAFENPREKNILNYFDFISWLNSKINDVSFHDAKLQNKI